MIQHGFPLPSDARNFVIAVNVTLGRLMANSKRIVCVEFGGKNYYRPIDAYK